MFKETAKFSVPRYLLIEQHCDLRMCEQEVYLSKGGHESDTDLVSCKLFRPLEGKVNVRRIVHHQASEGHRVYYSAKTRHGTAVLGSTVHYTRLHLHGALGCQYRSFSSVEKCVILQCPHLQKNAFAHCST